MKKHKTGNDIECELIGKLNQWQLLEYILENPDYLSDPYYEVFRAAIFERIRAMLATKKQHPAPVCPLCHETMEPEVMPANCTVQDCPMLGEGPKK